MVHGVEAAAALAAAGPLQIGENMFSIKNRNKISEAIRKAESKTSGEIVPVFVAASDDYDFFAHWLALIGLMIGSGVGVYLFGKLPFLGWITFFSLQGGGWILGWFLGQWGWFIRLSLGQKRFTNIVHEAALASFFRNGLHRTKDRTGVLIYISELEHRVEILADEGIHQKLPQNFWQEEVQKLARSIRSDSIAEVLPVVIDEIGQKLSEHFPKTSTDTNEISDSLRSN